MSKISVIPMPDYTSDNKQVGNEDKCVEEEVKT